MTYAEIEKLPDGRARGPAYPAAGDGGWSDWRHAVNWWRSMTQHVLPVIGELQVRAVRPEHVVRILQSIQAPSRRRKGRRRLKW